MQEHRTVRCVDCIEPHKGAFPANEIQHYRRDMAKTPERNGCEQFARLARAQARALGGRPAAGRAYKPEKAALRNSRERRKRLRLKEPRDAEARRAAKCQVEEDMGQRVLREVHASTRACADEAREKKRRSVEEDVGALATHGAAWGRLRQESRSFPCRRIIQRAGHTAGYSRVGVDTTGGRESLDAHVSNTKGLSTHTMLR